MKKHWYVVTAHSESMAERYPLGERVKSRFKGRGIQAWQFMNLATGQETGWIEAAYDCPCEAEQEAPPC